MRVIIAGGGTGGHIVPALAVARTLLERGHDVSFLGTEAGLESKMVPAAGFRFQPIRAQPFIRKASVATLRAPVVAVTAIRECRPHVRAADVVLGMGGYVSVPVVLAARREHVRAVLHEQNAVPGLANRALARLAGVVAVSFREAARVFPLRVRTVVTGNPVREQILRVPEERDALAKEGRRDLDLDEGRRTVVVFGGSQGALHVDRAAVGACRLLADRADVQIVLITGPAHLDVIRRAIPGGAAEGSIRVGGGNGILVRLIGFLDRMELAYACADLVVARAGATTVAELTVCSLPALLIPYPFATAEHQEANGLALQRAGGAIVMLDGQLSAASLADRIASLIDDQDRLQAMSEHSGRFGRPDAAERLADVVLSTGQGGGR